MQQKTTIAAKESSYSGRGFTLIEIMIAIFLLAVALLGLASVTTSVIKGNSFSQTLTTATTLAKDKMEELKATSYTDLPTTGTAGTVTDYASADGTVRASSTGSYYKREWYGNVTGTAPNTKNEITVTVTRSFGLPVELKTIRASD